MQKINSLKINMIRTESFSPWKEAFFKVNAFQIKRAELPSAKRSVGAYSPGDSESPSEASGAALGEMHRG